MDITTYIYAIKSEQLQLIKIGYSMDPDSRLETLSQQSPVELTYAAIWEGTHAEEKVIHQRLSTYRTRGEWLEMSERQAIVIVSEILRRGPIWRPERPRFQKSRNDGVAAISGGGPLAAERILEKIRSNKIESPFTVRYIQAKHWAGLGKAQEIKGGLDQLMAMGAVKWDPDLKRYRIVR